MKKIILILLLSSTAEAATYEARFNIDGVSNFVGKPPIEQDNWVIADSSYSDWDNMGDLYSCSAWSPLASEYLLGVAFNQNSLCKQKQVRSVQKKEINTKNNEIRNVGIPYNEEQEVDFNTTQSAIGTQVSFTATLSSTSTTNYTGLLLVGYHQQTPLTVYNHGNSMSKTDSGYQIHFRLKKDLSTNLCNITSHVSNGPYVDTGSTLNNIGPSTWLSKFNNIIVYNGSLEAINLPYTIIGGGANYERMQTENFPCSSFDIFYNNPSLLNKVKFIKK